MQAVINIGDIVRASYKSGEYIGEVTDLANKATVRIIAVLKHPTQGDLHNPYEAEVAMFHQRRALAFQEKALMPLDTVQPYRGPVPAYAESLESALRREIEMLERTVRWAEKSLVELESLKADYSRA